MMTEKQIGEMAETHREAAIKNEDNMSSFSYHQGAYLALMRVLEVASTTTP